MSRRGADRARDALVRALLPHLAPCRLVSAASRDWSSALFEGARHRLGLELDGSEAEARADRLERLLPDLELDIRGGFVADMGVVRRHGGRCPGLRIEALTIDEAVSRAAPPAG